MAQESFGNTEEEKHDDENSPETQYGAPSPMDYTGDDANPHGLPEDRFHNQ